MKLGRTLRNRLFLAIGAIVVLSVGLTLGIGVVLTRRAVEHAKIEEVGKQADLLAARERASLAPLFHLNSLRPFLTAQHEQVETAPLDRSSPYLSAERVAELRRQARVQGTVRVQGTTYYFAARPVAGKAFILLRRKRLEASLWPFAEGLLLAAAVGAGLAAAASFLLARKIARPARRVADASRSLAAGEAHRPIPVEGSDELAQLARSFNEMAAQLARAKEAEQAFLLSVSHELKTPLTAIRGYAEGVGEGAVGEEEAGEVILREARRLERLVQDLLDLARMNRSEFAVDRGGIDLAEAARDAVRRYEPQAAQFDVALRAETRGVAPAQGDADRVLQVVSNLVENALRSTPAGGSVTVRAEPGLLAVEDTGPGLEPEDLPRAFERFYLYRRHGGERRIGTGLGLAIVEQLTRAMGGSVEVLSRPGEGATFLVRLASAHAAVDRGGLKAGRASPPEHDEAAPAAEQLGERKPAGEPVVATDESPTFRDVAAVGDRDDVGLDLRLHGPA